MSASRHDLDDLTRVRDILTPINPVPAASLQGVSATPRARDLLAAVLADTPTTSGVTVDAPTTSSASPFERRPQRRPQVITRRALVGAVAAAAASAAVLASGVVTLPGRSGPSAAAYAATPRPLTFRPVTGTGDAVAVLTSIAEHTTGLADDTGSGRYARTSTQSWSLWTRVDLDGRRVTSRVVPQDATSWIAGDGSGVTIRRDRRSARQGHVERFEADPGRWMWPLGSLSADPGVLAAQLQIGHPTSDGPAERVVALADAMEQPQNPAVRAAALRYLAATPGLRLDGTTTDRLGRPGIAVSVDSDYSGLPTRYTVIVDPDSGRILDTEQMLTTTAGALQVRVPSVIEYAAYRASRYTSDVP